MPLDNGSLNPARCAKRECHITSFDVTIDPEAGSLTATIVDPCNQVTECRLAKAILTQAITTFLEDEEIAIPDGDCKFACCDGIYGVVYTVATNSATLENTSIEAGEPVTVEVIPPFGVVN